MARAELADCGHPVPDFPVFTDLRVFCTRYCREWFEPETDESEACDPRLCGQCAEADAMGGRL